MATVGRKKRKRAAGAGSGVTVKPHTRSPRGPDRGKKIVRVDPYKRGKPTTRKKKKGAQRKRRRKIARKR